MRRAVWLLAAALLLSGCAREAEESTPQETEAPVQETVAPTQEAQETLSPAPTEQPAEKPVTEVRQRGEIFREVLDTLREELLFPNGTEAVVQGEMEDNLFSLCDIDQDGREELIIRFDTAEGLLTAVYDVDERGRLMEELFAWPDVTIYENGVATVGMPETNVHYSDSFSGYSVYLYQPDSDRWEYACYVEAMELRTMQALGEEEEYPEEADTSGSGFVYYIGSSEPVDVTEYQAWREDLFGGAGAAEIPFAAFSEENIADVH